MQKTYKRPKKAAVSLTSLLDLLFVMIFVSMIQQKTQQVKAKPVPSKKVVKATVKTKTKAKPKPAIKSYGVFAEFNFHSIAGNPAIPSGTYLMQGFYDEKDGSLKLGGVSWIKRPTGYDMVPLSGKIDKNYTSFTGRIDSPGCRTFTLKRSTKPPGESPIVGVWKGQYDCSQGFTGLTLTIK